MFNFFTADSSALLHEILKKVERDSVAFIDVRTEGEYEAGHAKGAQNVPLHTLGNNETVRFEAFEEVYVICQSGGRSAEATLHLTSQGVRAVNVPGGTHLWKSLGLPMV
ncbi:MAG: rhodanese-like domain-containing protein [Candidatus Paceibacterota bacterium]